MSNAGSVLKLLVIGQDEEIIGWLRASMSAAKLPWRMRVVEPLRATSPDVNLHSYDVLILLWTLKNPVSLQEILTRTAPITRSPEGLLIDLEASGGEDCRMKTIAFGRNFTREEAVLLAESNVRLVLSLPEKRSKWESEAPALLQRIGRFHHELKQAEAKAEEKATRTFSELLGSWSRLSDETKMEATDNLLATLGDSARYADFMARKSLKEGDRAAAERWAMRAINKNPNYLQAMRMLAEIYIQGRRFDDALALLKKLNANSPRNMERLSRIGECLIAKGEYQKAEQILTDALQIDEYHGPAREALGKVKCVLGDYDSARKLFANTRNQRDLAVFMNLLGVQFVESKQFEKAIHHYKQAQFVLPGNEQSHMIFFNIALAYLKWGRLGEALSYARLAVTREPFYEKATKLLDLIEKRLSA